jgi:hypothetical protein
VPSSTLTFNGRLPGVACTPALPPVAQPIRLDVPAFVGLAERGPLHQPTAVEDINQYTALFGGDLVVAQDAGRPVYAHLRPTVASFFDNGGRRCYVVRVAGPGATPATAVIPGLRRWTPDGAATPVVVEAAWAGAWSAGLAAGTQLLEQPLAVKAQYRPGDPGARLQLDAASALLLAGGDVIRLDLGPALPGVYLVVGSTAPGGPGGTWTVTPTAEIPFAPATGSPPSGPGAPEPASAVDLLEADQLSVVPAPRVPVVTARLLRLDLVVRQNPPAGGPARQLEQWVDLTFNPGNAPRPAWTDVLQPPGDPLPPADLTRSLLLRARAEPDDGGLYVPVGMDQLGTPAEFVDQWPGSPPDPAPVEGSDDLDHFDPVALFLDPRLSGETVLDLVDDAHQYTVFSPTPVALRGIHSLIDVDEVAMVSVPDAVQRGWTRFEPVPVPVTPPPAPVPTPVDWSRFRDCAVPAPPPPPDAPPGPVPTVSDVPVLDDLAAYDPNGLLSVQVALVELCAARADAVAVLSVPAHYRGPDYLDWYRRITSDERIIGAPLGYAAVWHPWVRIVEPTTPSLDPLRAIPPDGPACGTVAAREAERGVWLAPANVALRGVLDLTPALGDAEAVGLFDAHDNLVRHQAGVFAAACAHTLSGDPAMLQLSVRRLLIFLRKVALQQGMRYVFQTNTDRFRQLVRISFERLLTRLTQLGAMVDYRVITDAGVTTADDEANGRLVVNLAIAPTSPVEFITVTLVRAGEGLLDVLEA